MEPLARTRVELSPADRERLREAVERELPRFAPRLRGVLEVDRVEQPFFEEVDVLDVQSPAPFPATRIFVARAPAHLFVLTAHLANLRDVCAIEPPAGIADPKMVTTFALHADAWTTESELGELKLDSLDEVPWFTRLDEAQAARKAEVERVFASQVRPRQLTVSVDDYRLTFWLLSDRRLVERTLIVPPTGQLQRIDLVHADSLPVPPGKMWGVVNGRLVPTG